MTWLKRKTVYTDGARATVGVRNGVVALIKQITPYKLVNEETTCQLVYMLCDVIEIVDKILKNSMSNCAFHKLFREMGGDGRLVYHSKVRWLSRGRVLERVWKFTR